MDKNGVNLKKFRRLCDLTGSKQKIGNAVGCDYTTVSKHYSGDRVITTNKLKKYAEFFGVSADYLLDLPVDYTATRQMLQSISSFTGLSKSTVQKLNRLTQDKKTAEFIEKYINLLYQKENEEDA